MLAAGARIPAIWKMFDMSSGAIEPGPGLSTAAARMVVATLSVQ
jgi:hypothetical protein